jgi:FKBP-type peptidyl-prolyl cis-trans isomerase (trigger factor)
MTSTIQRETDGTIRLTVHISWNEIKKTQEEIMNKIAKTAKIPGFRAGKAPKKLVEESADKQKIREEVLKQLLPQKYIEAVQEHNLKPIVNPKIHVEKLEDNEEWIFTATTCEMPKVELNNYKDAIKTITAKTKIVVPGKEPQEPKLDDILNALLKSVKVTIPDMLIEHEVDRLLSQLLDEIKRLGLTLDQYLASTNRTPEQLRKEYEERAKNDLILEFALAQIAEAEKITVDAQEIEEAIQKAKDSKEKEHLQNNRYLLASILRQQKTLDFLRSL